MATGLHCYTLHGKLSCVGRVRKKLRLLWYPQHLSVSTASVFTFQRSLCVVIRSGRHCYLKHCEQCMKRSFFCTLVLQLKCIAQVICIGVLFDFNSLKFSGEYAIIPCETRFIFVAVPSALHCGNSSAYHYQFALILVDQNNIPCESSTTCAY